jgi:hypothetical protein
MKKLSRVSTQSRASGFLPLILLLLAAAGFTLRAVDEKFESFQASSNGITEKLGAFVNRSSNYIARFETLVAGTNTYFNATVINTNRKDIFLRHAGGFVNVKVKDVDPQILKQLGYKVAEAEPKGGKNALGPISNQMMTNLTQKLEDNQQFQALENRWHAQLAPRMPPISKRLIASVAGVFLAVYLFFSFCCMLIVRKTGNQPGILVWLPIVKMLPLIRAAGMPGWWFLLWLLPVVNIVPAIMWCFKIVETRGKSVIWAILLLLPVTNLLAFLYLAFSDGAAPEDKPDARPLARAA